MIAQFREISKYYFGDYYPLTPYSLADDAWLAWQYHRDDLNEGFFQVMRRSESPVSEDRMKLKGLDADAEYIIRDMDKPEKPFVLTGNRMTNEGVPVKIETAPHTMIMRYERRSSD
jgi:alpha-galactosidase